MKFLPLIGRILFSAIFLMFGMGHFADTAAMSQMVPGWMPAPTLVTWITGLIIILGGLSVLLGYRVKVGALLLVAFLIPTAFLGHFQGFLAGDQMATANFMKDLALGGAALLIYHFGAGPMSMDARQAPIEAG